ncbi:oxygenase MpaB family protein [Stutzerimonas stutzeri]|uniref:Histidine kinase n=1 Tax=Stutzerimonas stutzeri TaxID=316 RepID=A0A2N8RA00_STUST|nr:oxygenase MpaB family protein [Stutzerimonas stutzeri]MCQ4255681.1 oxygenase MpaB family protein [Stutzerimonas stutzeri]PNF57920.1 histidine kinase [Stutzerimonas stutzeri]
MELIRQHIETRVLSLTGLAIGGVDYESPPGDPGLFGPDSVCWRVHGDFTSMMVGGISALLLQALHPLALAGVWDHSNFRDDLLGRLRRTGQFIAATTFGSHADADRLIERVRRIHSGVTGTAPDGRAYAASDPDLLTWVHVAEVSSFLKSHLRYLNPALSAADQNRYYAEVALIAERLGAREVPRSRVEIEAYFERVRPQLYSDERALEILQILRTAPAPSRLLRPFGTLMLHAGVELMPDWATVMFGLTLSEARRQLIRTGVRNIAPVLRWAVRNASVHRARRRMGLPSR